METFWIFICLVALALAQPHLIDVQCPKNHFLVKIVVNVPHANDSICIVCDRLLTAEASVNSSKSVALCYANSMWQIDQLDLKHDCIKNTALCGLTFNLKSESLPLTGLLTCAAKDNHRKKSLESGSLLCPGNSSLVGMSRSIDLTEACVRCEWNNPSHSRLCFRKSVPEEVSREIYSDPDNSRCHATQCKEEQLMRLNCGYRLASDVKSFFDQEFNATNLISCFERKDILEVRNFGPYNRSQS